jgi:hypothetical protein
MVVLSSELLKKKFSGKPYDIFITYLYITINASVSSITSPFHLYMIDTVGIRQTPTAISSFNRELE